MDTEASTHAKSISSTARGNADLYITLMLYWRMKDNWDVADMIVDLDKLPAATRDFIQAVKWSWRLASTIRTPGSAERDIMTAWTRTWLYDLTTSYIYACAPYVYHELLLALQDRHFAENPDVPFTLPAWYDKNYDITADLSNWAAKM